MCSKTFSSPQYKKWWRNAVIYQIYPLSFSDANGDGIGDIPGVTKRMNYIKALGVDAIWLSPFYPSPFKDGGYDVANYRDVDSRLGTLDDVDTMIHAAHEGGIKVVVDIVPNHTSDQHEWFKQALEATPGSSERERYIFHKGKGNNCSEPPSNWMSDFGGSAWQPCGDGWYYLHLFAPEQPDLNWDNREVRDDFLKTLRFWGDRGVDGFRVDVSHALVKDLNEPLRDRKNPTDTSPQSIDGSDPLWDRNEVHEIYREWRTVLDSYDPPRFAIGETWSPITPRVFEYARQDELGTVFDFSLLKSAFDANEYRHIIDRTFTGAVSVGASPVWVFGNHDVPRIASRLGLKKGEDIEHWVTSNNTDPPIDQQCSARRARVAALIQFGLPGTVFIYQGEELGLPEDLDLTSEQLQDPIWERSSHTFKGRDGCRVPMPWSAAVGKQMAFGFNSTGKSSLPQPDWFARYAADTQGKKGDGSVLSLYKNALELRKEYIGENDIRQGITWHDDELERGILSWSISSGLRVIANCSDDYTAQVPQGLKVILASEAIDDTSDIPATTAVWCVKEN